MKLKSGQHNLTEAREIMVDGNPHHLSDVTINVEFGEVSFKDERLTVEIKHWDVTEKFERSDTIYNVDLRSVQAEHLIKRLIGLHKRPRHLTYRTSEGEFDIRTFVIPNQTGKTTIRYTMEVQGWNVAVDVWSSDCSRDTRVLLNDATVNWRQTFEGEIIRLTGIPEPLIIFADDTIIPKSIF
jgi:hypothetical protein